MSNADESNDGATEGSFLLPSSPTSLSQLRRQRRLQQQQQHETDEPFAFGSLGSIDELQEHIGEIARDMVTFEVANPDELMREAEEYRTERGTDRTDENDNENHPNDELIATVEQEEPEDPRQEQSRTESFYDGLTYPEEQVIESHYTENPEKLGCVALAVLVFCKLSCWCL